MRVPAHLRWRHVFQSIGSAGGAVSGRSRRSARLVCPAGGRCERSVEGRLGTDRSPAGEIETGRPVVEPALRRLRLCRDALIASGRDPIDFEPSYSGDPAFDKFDVPLGPVSSADPIPLAAVILLEFGVTEILQEVGGVEAATILFAHTYRGAIVDQSGTAEMHWQAVVRLVTTVRIFRWQRPRDRAGIEHGTSRLVTTLRALGAGGPDQSLVDQVG